MSTQDHTPLLAQGEERLSAEDWDGAVAVFSQAVAAAPTSAVAHSKLGVAYVYRRQWEDASTEFSKAIQLDPRYAPAHSNLGNVHRERGRLDDAVACYLRAIALDPEYAIAHQNLGVVYKQQGRIGDAVREFKTSARLSLRPRSMDRFDPHSPTVAHARPRIGCLGTGGAVLLLLSVLAALAHR
jgi:Flp pilus assembly protein TadD